MELPNYYQNILKNRDNIINYYVKQYGEETRKMFEERFDRIKFCIFVNPNSIDNYIFLSKYKDTNIEAIKLLTDLGFNPQELKSDETRVRADNEEITKKIRTCFYIGSLLDSYEYSNNFKLCRECSGIFIFRSDEEFYHIIDMAIDRDNKRFNKQHSRDTLISERKCDFLRKMGMFPDGATDDEILNSPNFEELNHYYTNIADKYFTKAKEIENKYRALELYASEMRKKISVLTEKNAEDLEMNDDELNEEISKLCIIGGDYEIDGSINLASFGSASFNYLNFDTETGSVNELIVFYNPFSSSSGNEDINLRHEIRHAMTSSAKLLDDGVIEIKIGNQIQLWKNGELLKQDYNDYNEYVTEYEAIKETIDAYDKGIYIISPPSIIHSNYSNIGAADYDYYLPYFEIIYCQLSEIAKRSQIEDNNDSLYELISEEQLKYIEELINKKDINALNGVKQTILSSNKSR